MKIQLKLALFGLLFFVISSGVVKAYQVQPLVIFLSESGSLASGTFRLTNTNTTPLTIEVSVLRREIDENGQQINVPADDDFLVMPPQTFVEPGEFQVFRVQYLGDADLSQTVGYRLLFQQLPVDLEPVEGSGVRFLMNVSALMFVSPPSAVAEPVARVSYSAIADQGIYRSEDAMDLDNTQGVVVLTNNGTGVQDLQSVELTLITESNEQKVLRWEDFAGAVSARFLLPGFESRLALELVEGELEERISRVDVRVIQPR
ncbi:MAG: fimbria/pilus periplasmic chaperone [Idiomarina sp.]|nr:fimbria/pilus periplasmic chaperone [Idiomarina sp.]